MSSFLFVSPAYAKQISVTHFFDFSFAKTLWTDFDRNALFAYDKKHCPEGGSYELWMSAYRDDPEKMVKSLEDDPDADVIKRCADIVLTHEVWKEAYRNWRSGLRVYGSKGWNKDTGDIKCINISAANVFTQRCDDLPDWRHPDEVKADDAAVHKGNSRWIKK